MSVIAYGEYFDRLAEGTTTGVTSGLITVGLVFFLGCFAKGV